MQVAESEKNLRLAQRDLTNTKSELEQLNTQLSLLRRQFEEKTAEQQDLKSKADLMERRLLAASRLIAGLGSERTRWGEEITELDSRKERLVGDCLLTSSFLSYTGEQGGERQWGVTYMMGQRGRGGLQMERSGNIWRRVELGSDRELEEGGGGMC